MRIKRDKTTWKTLRTACANLRGVIDAGLRAYFEEYLAATERLLADNDQRGFYKHLKDTVGLVGRKARSEQFIMDEDGTMLKDKVRILERWAGYFGTLLNTKSPELDPNISGLFPQWPLAPSVGGEPTMDGMTKVIRGMPNWKAVGPDSLPAELLKIENPEFIRYFDNLLVNVCERETSLSSGKMQPLRSFVKRGIALIATSTEGFRLLPIQAKYY